MEMVRCPHCRGVKQVAQLGGVIGDCKTCNATGKIKVSDKVPVVIPQPAENVAVIKDAVCAAVPWVKGSNEAEPSLNAKKAVFKKKKG